MDFVGTAKPLNSADVSTEASALGIEAAAVWAVCEVESAGSGFLLDKRPKILFEAHAFHTLTRGIYDRAYSNISSPFWDRSLYGAAGAHQYDRLEIALGLNHDFALESASWGRFQIMGSNFDSAGYSDVQTFVKAMMDDEANHLSAFGNFCANNGLIGYLKLHDWEHFALRYNGPGNVADYAGKLADAYDRFKLSTPTTPTSAPLATLRWGSTGSLVSELQQILITLGYNIKADGVFGGQTDAAIRDFQQKHSLFIDGVVGPITWALLAKVS